MIEWQYKAKSNKGTVSAGSLFAANKKDAEKQVRSMKLKPIYVKEYKETFLNKFYTVDEKGNILVTLGGSKPSLKDIAIFTKQFSIMVERGVPIIQSLAILGKQQKNYKLSQVLDKISTLIENGSTLSDAMSMYPDCFDKLYIAMLKAGEVSGNLDKVLIEIVKFLDKAIKLKRQIKSASVYPAIVSVVAAAITYAIIAFMVPVFADQYKNMGHDLPIITQFVVDLSNFLSNQLYLIIGGIIALVVGFNYTKSNPEGRKILDNIALKMPIIGDVMSKIAIGRFASTMSTMMGSGVSILEALTICGASSGNKVIEDFIENIKDSISQGSNFSTPLSEGSLFPPMVISMVAVGEQTGALDETLAKVSEIYEEEVDVAVNDMTEMIQPILIVAIGAILGFVVIALYMPIFDQASMVG